jgi:hypothetical protein
MMEVLCSQRNKGVILMASNTPFHPQHLIVLSELTTKEKEFYYNLLINNECKFHHNDQGHCVVNLRLLAPGFKKIENIKKKKKSYQTNSFPFEERLLLLQEEGGTGGGTGGGGSGNGNGSPMIHFIGIEGDFDYNSYPRFSFLITTDGETIQPRLKLLSWLMRYIEDLYDSRFAYEAAEVSRDSNNNSHNNGHHDSDNYHFLELKISYIFPIFVIKRISMKLGLRSIVEQTSWDLLYNAHQYRKDYLEVEIFCRFLQEFYDHDDLLFFLYVRSIIAKQLHISYKTRWGKVDGPGRQPKSLWLSYKECVAVAKAVFGETNEMMCRDFLAIVSPQMVGQKSDGVPPQGGGVGVGGNRGNGGGGGSDTRRIDITQFLHLAVVGYHQTRPEEGGGGGGEGYGGAPYYQQPPQQHASALPGARLKDSQLPSGESQLPSGLPGGGGGSVGSGHGLGPNTPYRTLPGEVNPPVPPIAPSGGDYMSRFAPRSLTVPTTQPAPAKLSHFDSQPAQYDDPPGYSYGAPTDSLK